MKRIIAVLLIACLCFSIAACGTNENKPTSIESDNNAQTTEPNKAEPSNTEQAQKVIETGLTIETLKAVAGSSVEEYKENDTEFSFSTIFAEWCGRKNDSNVLEFTIELDKVILTTVDEFSEAAYYAYTDYKQLIYNQSTSACSVMYIMEICAILGESDITLGEASRVIVNNKTLTVGKWSLSATFDDSADNVKITGIYQE